MRTALAVAAGFSLAACATARPAATAAAGNPFWKALADGDQARWDGRAVSLSGFVVARAPRSVVLTERRPRRRREGSWDYDPSRCVTLLVSAAQYARLRSGERAVVTGEFGIRSLMPDRETIVTRPAIRDRRTSPECSGPNWRALLLYADDIRTSR